MNILPAWTSKILAQKGKATQNKTKQKHMTYILRETQEGSHHSVPVIKTCQIHCVPVTRSPCNYQPLFPQGLWGCVLPKADAFASPLTGGPPEASHMYAAGQSEWAGDTV